MAPLVSDSLKMFKQILSVVDYYSIKKDKYCNGVWTGHSLNLAGLKCMNSIRCLTVFFFFLKTEMFVFNQTAGLNANDASGRINTAYVNVNLPISASA